METHFDLPSGTLARRDLIVTYGIHSDGARIQRLTNQLRHIYNVHVFHHPRRWALSAYSYKVRRSDAMGIKKLAGQLDTVPDFMGHSYGALLGLEAMKLGAEFHNVFLFGAAASSDKEPINLMRFQELHNYYNPKDRALLLGSFLPAHVFGKLGYIGYRGVDDDRVFNHDTFMTKGLLRHSGYFDGVNVAKIKADIEEITERQKNGN